MAREITGYTFQLKNGRWGIRWSEDGRRPQETLKGRGFKTEAEANRWFRKNVAPRLDRGGPSAAITFERFVEGVYLPRWGRRVEQRTRDTVEEWLKPARAEFGSWTLAELEHASDDLAAFLADEEWTDDQRHKRARGLRQVFRAAKRWHYIERDPALDAGDNPQAPREEVRPFSDEELKAIEAELAGGNPRDLAIVILAAETGVRTHEWTGWQRLDVSRSAKPSIAVARRYSGGRYVPYPKTSRSLRRVPLTPRALAAIDTLPAAIGTVPLFANRWGDPLNYNNWVYRHWTPALKAAGVEQRGPYHLRHTFATNALARPGMTGFMAARVMGTSEAMIDRHYGHLREDSIEVAYDILAAGQ